MGTKQMYFILNTPYVNYWGVQCNTFQPKRCIIHEGNYNMNINYTRCTFKAKQYYKIIQGLRIIDCKRRNKVPLQRDNKEHFVLTSPFYP